MKIMQLNIMGGERGEEENNNLIYWDDREKEK